MTEKTENVFKNISNTIDGNCQNPECRSSNLCMISFDTIQCGDCFELLGNDEDAESFEFDLKD